MLKELGYTTPRASIRSIVLIEVDSAAPIISPAYAGGVTEEEVAASWLRRYEGLNK